MKYSELRPLNKHLEDVIGIWGEHNIKSEKAIERFTQEDLQALKDTVTQTVLDYLRG